MNGFRESLIRAAGFTAICVALGVMAPTAPSQEQGATTNVPGMQPGIHLVAPVADGQWTIPAGDYGDTRFSPLAQINTSNVKNLHYVMSLSTGIPHGHEGQPLVVGKTLYMVTPFPNDLIALDLTKPGFPVKWIYHPDPDNIAVGHACCDIVNRGAAYADGLIVYNTLDDHTIAVDANTGKLVWRTVVGDDKASETETMAPLIAKNVVLVGISGSELGVRGRLMGLDLHSGKILWRAWSTGSDADVRIGKDFKPFYKKDQGKDLGLSTWNSDNWKRGGGTVWGWLSYDPELNLVYYGTGNSGPWDEDKRPGDNKWDITIFARDPETGYAKWAFQVVPHAGWDFDQMVENVLVDMPWKGKERKLLIRSGKTGYVMVMDRETGELLSAVPFVPVTWSNGYDLQTGLPYMNLSKETHEGKPVTDICPSNLGGKNQSPTAFSPRTGYLYIPADHICMDKKDLPVNYIAGTPYVGASVLNYVPKGESGGELIAWDVAHAKRVWGISSGPLPTWSGLLVTGGDVLFYGTLDGWFKAVDARTGKELWQFKTQSGIVGNPITFLGPDGKQYIAIYSGIGGALGGVDFPSVSSDDPYAALGAVYAASSLKEKVAPGGALYVFSL